MADGGVFVADRVLTDFDLVAIRIELKEPLLVQLRVLYPSEHTEPAECR